MKGWIATLLIILLCGCSSFVSIMNKTPAKYAGPATSCHVKIGDVSPHVGLTTGPFNGHRLIRVRGDITPEHRRMVTTHELMHVLGFKGHIMDNKQCYFHYAPSARAPQPFCDQDIALIKLAAQRNKRIITVTASDDIRADVIWGIARIEEAAEKKLFELK